MNVFQALIIALFVYLGSIGTPWLCGNTGGWYTLGRPLIASMIVGIVMGDMTTALTVGVALQAMYIGVITPGAVLPFDVAYAGYLVPALIIGAKADPAIATTLAVAAAMIGVALWNVVYVANLAAVHRADKYAAAGDTKGIRRCNMFFAQAINFVVRAVPAFIILYFGSNALQSIVLPPMLISYLGVVSGMLPALGIGLLLNMIIREKAYIGVFIVGFVISAYLNLPIIAIAVIGAVIAVFYYRSAAAKAKMEV
ncbi:PTS sugar transporter subunit IIC [Oscillospiraceae bacterium PP1C4]